jgi:predicted  nucleic acid-binding Zn-ribbon protein
MIKLDEPKVYALVKEKDSLVNEGRALSKKIDSISIAIKAIDDEERKITDKVLPKDLLIRGEALKAEINKKVEELGKIGDEIAKAKIDAIPKELKDRHYSLRADRERMEKERNKIGLKIQKVKSKLVPMVQKAAKPFLKDEFEDFDTAKIVGKQVHVSTFSHLENWKQSFKKGAR